MSASRIKNGEFRFLSRPELFELVSEYYRECEVLDMVQPSFEAWAAAKLYDLRHDSTGN